MVGVSYELEPDACAFFCDAFDGELLLPEDIEALLRSDPTDSMLTAVFTAENRSAVAIARISEAEGSIAHLDLLVTDMGHRRRGKARSVLVAAEAWARGQGAEWLEVGDHLPRGLFGGVDVRWTAAMCLFESRGYQRVAVKVDLSCPTIMSSPQRPGAGMRAVRVSGADQVRALHEFVSANEPRHSEAFETAADWGTAVIAIGADTGQVFGAAVHSLQRLGVVGPIVCGPGADERIVIAVLFRTLLADLSTAGLKSVEIVGASKMTPFVEAVGARTARVSLVLRRRLS